MGNLVAFEVRKLIHERQLHFAVLLILVNLAYVYFFLTESVGLNEVSGSVFASWLNSGASDTAFILIFLGLSTASVFSADYSYHTYKNFVPYTGIGRVYFAKILVNLVSLLALLLLWYALAIVFSTIKAGDFDVESVVTFLPRFATQYPHVVFNGGLLALVAALVRNRGITNIALVLSWFAYGFIPVAGTPVYAHVSRSLAWGAEPNVILVAVLIAASVVLYAVAGVITCKREVRV
jgi:hypothetical protein